MILLSDLTNVTQLGNFNEGDNALKDEIGQGYSVDSYKTATLVVSAVWSPFNVEDKERRKRESRGDGVDGAEGGGGKEPTSVLYSLCSTQAAAI